MPALDLCRQLLVSITPSAQAVEGVMVPFARDPSGAWREAWPFFPIVVGKNGMAKDKREGDGCSPIGCFPLVQAFGSERSPVLRMPYFHIQGLEGVDDPASRYYNRLVRRQETGVVDWKSAERMDEVGEEYDWGVVVGYNWVNPKPGAGSCIFLHIWKRSNSGTAGCTAMEGSTMRKLVHWLDSASHPHLLQCPRDLYEDLRVAEHLPALRIP